MAGVAELRTGGDHDLLIEIRSDVRHLAGLVEEMRADWRTIASQVNDHAEHFAALEVRLAKSGGGVPPSAPPAPGANGRGYYLPRWALYAIGGMALAVVLRWVSIEVDWNSIFQAASVVEKVR